MINIKLFNRKLVVIHIFYRKTNYGFAIYLTLKLWIHLFYVKCFSYTTFVYQVNPKSDDWRDNKTFSDVISQNAVSVLAVSTSDAAASTSTASTAAHVKKQPSKISMLTIIQIIEIWCYLVYVLWKSIKI